MAAAVATAAVRTARRAVAVAIHLVAAVGIREAAEVTTKSGLVISGECRERSEG